MDPLEFLLTRLRSILAQNGENADDGELIEALERLINRLQNSLRSGGVLLADFENEKFELQKKVSQLQMQVDGLLRANHKLREQNKQRKEVITERREERKEERREERENDALSTVFNQFNALCIVLAVAGISALSV